MIKVTTEIATLLVLMAPSFWVALLGMPETLLFSPRLQARCLEAAISLSNLHSTSPSHTHFCYRTTLTATTTLYLLHGELSTHTPPQHLGHPIADVSCMDLGSHWSHSWVSPFPPYQLLVSWSSTLSCCLFGVNWPGILCAPYSTTCMLLTFPPGAGGPQPCVHVPDTPSP